MSQYQMDSVKSDRVFYRPMGWYFATREGLDMGPFPSRRSAEAEIGYYLESMKKLSKTAKKEPVIEVEQPTEETLRKAG
ncbi:hypothetical protein FLL45_19905 [Aliikangiella marina]|uniref:DUF6316 domain-containing protein n=1 Tax=Aliikangiella marina TaxID=1712262 RepID=A0A545T2I5_9GAMM|nr:DUF6316 family protein [Aliikangiella marina]TQV71422.1 hypothetical protein FLL45_19905 [Aliikangiella marina]